MTHFLRGFREFPIELPSEDLRHQAKENLAGLNLARYFTVSVFDDKFHIADPAAETVLTAGFLLFQKADEFKSLQ